MGWSYGVTPDGKEVGYGVPDICHEPGCKAKIHRGLAHVCGSMHGGENGCGEYFCEGHLHYGSGNQRCGKCSDEYWKEHPEEEDQ